VSAASAGVVLVVQASAKAAAARAACFNMRFSSPGWSS
jgi:ABC-type proline/glycine betaine transport system substrate-binding protein